MAKFSCHFASAVIVVLCVALPTFGAAGGHLYDANLPEEHMSHFFYSNPDAARSCEEDPSCPFKHHLNSTDCWGYEPGCSKRYSVSTCPESAKGWAKNKQEQLDLFFKQGDFGFISERKKSLNMMCRPRKAGDSLLECVPHMELCIAKNIWMDFGRLVDMPEPMKYRDDVLGKGMVGGHHCVLDKEMLRQNGDRKSPLQSWYAELEHFETDPGRGDTPNEGCEVVVNRPTILMKLDATVNIYHHFCDFVNLYLTLHFNNSLGRDYDILLWDTLPYRGNFAPTWLAFTSGNVRTLSEFRGKKVCFREAVFSFLPRMIFGMYYNMPLVPGCSGSRLFKAFNRHVLHRLKIKVEPPEEDVRVTLLSRTTKHRRILNEVELVAAAQKLPGVSVRMVDFNHATNFLEQIEVSANTDILIGIHGAGLTHVLFQPDWGVLFEIYHCEDAGCYKDLARLRGAKYITWENLDKLYAEDKGHHPTLGAHAKFTNYRFDVAEFLRLLKGAVNHVRKKRPQTVSTTARPRLIHDEI